jgi:hypothetical protein
LLHSGRREQTRGESGGKPLHPKGCLLNRLQGTEEIFVLIVKYGTQIKEQGVLLNPGDNPILAQEFFEFLRAVA